MKWAMSTGITTGVYGTLVLLDLLENVCEQACPYVYTVEATDRCWDSRRMQQRLKCTRGHVPFLLSRGYGRT